MSVPGSSDTRAGKSFGSDASVASGTDVSTQRPLNAYWCHLEGRTYGMSYDPPDPGEYVVPCGIYIAETRGQAKRMLLAECWRCTEQEEFLDVRTNTLERGVTDCVAGPLEAQAPRGDDALEGFAAYGRLWGRVADLEQVGNDATALPPTPEASK